MQVWIVVEEVWIVVEVVWIVVEVVWIVVEEVVVEVLGVEYRLQGHVQAIEWCKKKGSMKMVGINKVMTCILSFIILLLAEFFLGIGWMIRIMGVDGRVRMGGGGGRCCFLQKLENLK